jgi:hypothetical protein
MHDDVLPVPDATDVIELVDDLEKFLEIVKDLEKPDTDIKVFKFA